MVTKIEVGDTLVGITETWLDTQAEVLFVAADGQSGDILIDDGEQIYVTFNHFQKLS
jgi:hypothetical protein